MLGKQINLTGDNTTITSSNFSVDKDGNMTCNGAVCSNISLASEHLSIASNGIITMSLGNSANGINLQTSNNSRRTVLSPSNLRIVDDGTGRSVYVGYQNISFSPGSCFINQTQMNATEMYAEEFINMSLETKKKNFEELKTVMNIVKEADIYKYNYKTEEDGTKRHIGFVIGEKYNTPKEIISNNGQGIDTYSMASILWKAVQEQQEQIEQLQNKINEMEEK